MPDVNPRVVVDVHTHLFNANFLPLYSVLKKWVPGTWADLAQRYIEGRVDRCEGGISPMAFSDDRDFEDILSDDEDLIEQLYDPAAAETLRTEDAQFALSSLATAYASAAAAGGGQWMAFGRFGLSSHRAAPSLSGSPHRRPPP